LRSSGFRGLAAALLLLALATPAIAQDARLSFARDIAPLVARHCIACHDEGGDAPFSLHTAGDVRARAATVAAVVRTRYMPPWKPAPGYGEFHGERRLSDVELARIVDWAASGAALDVPAETAVAPPARGATPRADAIVQLPAYRLRADGPDVFRNFVVPVPTSGARFVRGLEFRQSGRAVHHANIRVDRTRASRQLDDADPEPGYEGLILRSADFPDGHFLGWTPGQLGPVLSDDLAWPLAAGSDLVVQLHLRPTGRVEEVAPIIGLYFTDQPPARRSVMLRVGRQTLNIPAGARDHRVEDTFVLPVDADIRAVQPHAHFRAREVEAWAALPDGKRRELLRITDWDARWQDRYRYRAPVRLPAGTRIVARYTLDNSADNPRNPVQPPAAAEWGWRTSDEMADVWFQLVAADEAERPALQREARARMLAEDALGCEQLLRRDPGHIALRNDTALIYMALGRPAEALTHFEFVRQHQPDSAPAWFNEGVALEALGRPGDAEARYREALRRQPEYSAALNNLGALAMRAGRTEPARAALELAVKADAANGEARANLGMLLMASGDPDRAVREVDEALRVEPDLVGSLTPFAWLLAAHPSGSARRPAAALTLATRIVDATHRRNPDALDVLAAAYAAQGDFATATRLVTEALAGTNASNADAMRARLALYREGKAFVLAP
jgi:tetratricopeptide (TPR) repeat protein